MFPPWAGQIFGLHSAATNGCKAKVYRNAAVWNISELYCYCHSLSTLKNRICNICNILWGAFKNFYQAAEIVPQLVWCTGCDWLRLMLNIDIFDGCCVILALILSHKDSQNIDGLLMCQMKIHFYHDSFLSLLSVDTSHYLSVFLMVFLIFLPVFSSLSFLFFIIACFSSLLVSIWSLVSVPLMRSNQIQQMNECKI